jgi:hypothetical protein
LSKWDGTGSQEPADRQKVIAPSSDFKVFDDVAIALLFLIIRQKAPNFVGAFCLSFSQDRAAG